MDKEFEKMIDNLNNFINGFYTEGYRIFRFDEKGNEIEVLELDNKKLEIIRE